MAAKKKLTSKRAARGTGSVFYSRRLHKWVGRIPVGRTAKGHTQYRSVYRDTQAAAVAALKTLVPPGPSTTVREWAKSWLDTSPVRVSTHATYSYTVQNFIVPTLGSVRLSALSTAHVESALRQWGMRVGPGTLRVYLGQLRNCLNAARRAGAITVNPASLVRTPKLPKKPPKLYAPDELPRILEASTEKPALWVVALMAATGMRPGEALALDIDDYDRETGCVSITKTWTRRHGTRPPKSPEGERTVRVPDGAARLALTRSIGKRRHGPLFTCVYRQVTRRYHESVRVAFAGLLKRLGLAKRNLHQLRHMVASALNHAGVPIPDAARHLGHTPEVYVSTYLHPSTTDPSEALERVLKGGAGVGAKRRPTGKQA